METRSLSASINTFRILAAIAAGSLLAACGGGGGGGGGSTPTPTATFTIGGTVSGLASGASVVLQNNGGNATTVSTNGAFTFSTAITSGGAYAVTVQTQPTGQTCAVASGTGTATANVTNVAVTCANNPTFAVGGTVSGLASGASVVLQNNGANSTTVSANGVFTFSTAIATGGAYAVAVQTQPTGQTCIVANGSGTVAAAAVTNVAVTCTTNPPNTFTVGGTLSGLASGASVVLRNNGGNNLTVSANGAYTFTTAIATGGAYAVTVFTQPTNQTCTVANASGTIASANITNVNVTCVTNAPNTFTVGGTVSGLATGASVVLRNNGGNNLTVSANGAFTFTTAIATGGAYAVTVFTQPTTPTQNCTVANGSGTVASANITNVIVTCATLTFTVGGTISGLRTGDSLVLRNNANAATDLTVSANGNFTFTAPVASGAAYAVTIQTQTTPAAPPRACDVTAGSGTVGAANVTNVVVSCHAKFAYIANRSGDARLTSYSIGAAGLLTQVDFESLQGEPLTGQAGNCLFPGVDGAADANGVAVTPTGSHALVTVDNQLATDPCFAAVKGRIKVYEIDAAGALTVTPTVVDVPNVTPTPNVSSDPSTILMHPSGNFVYVQDANSNTVNGTIVSGGNNVIRSYVFNPGVPGTTPPSLTPTAGAGYVAIANLQTMEIDPAGTFMMASNYNAHSITKLPINTTTGVLGAAAGNVVVGTVPSALHIAVDSTGTYMFVSHEEDATIYSYVTSTMAVVTNALSTTHVSDPAPTKVVGMAVDPVLTRPYLYAARADGSIDVYQITGLTGAIAYVQTYRRTVAPQPLGGVLYGLAIDPDGKFLYHSSQSTGGDLGIFSIGANGVLTEVTGSPFTPANTGTRNIAIR